MKSSIVVVDDDPIIRMDIREMLEEEGYAVAGEAKNGQEAVELVGRLRPDLVIMDVKMPEMNGIKATQIIRKWHETSVLLLTAYSQRELVQEAQQAGVGAYLVKPVTEADLLPAVAIALSQKRKLDALRKDLEELKQTVEDRKRIERAKGMLMKVMGLDEEEAYRKLRGMSMEERLPLGKLAERVLKEGPEAWARKTAGQG